MKPDNITHWTIVPAAPGFSLVEPLIHGDKVVGLDLTPIVAWMVEYSPTSEHGDEPSSYALPVTAENRRPGHWAILEPSGITRFPFNATFAPDSDEKVIANFQRLEDFAAAIKPVPPS